MQTPPVPANESARIAALHALNILDTAPEERFDRLTRLARRVFNVPVFDHQHDRLAAPVVQVYPGASPCVRPPGISRFAHNAILFDDILYVENALKDARFSDNPVVIGDPKIRFYAGCS